LGVKKKINSTKLLLSYLYTNNQLQLSPLLRLNFLLSALLFLRKQLAILLSEKAVDLSHSNSIKKSKDDDTKPKKKRTSGYILYSNAHRDQVKDSFTNDDEKPKNTDIMKKLAQNYKLLSQEERDSWIAKANEIKDDNLNY
tara:strand:- start:833 stop:1255 length:423 start_codon:yes stop_codon:yes gene_type:complete